jgi:hypothetical protein
VRGIPSSNTFSKEFITDSYTLSAHGEPIPQTSAQAAVTTLNVETMLAELNKGGNASGDAALMSRHFLMLNIVGEAYKKRLEDSRMREICKTVGRRHVKEFPEIKNPLKKFLHIDFLPAVPTFQRLATVLTEDMEFDEAIEVCRSAIEYGIDSETADGFEKKIEEIENAQQASSQ